MYYKMLKVRAQVDVVLQASPWLAFTYKNEVWRGQQILLSSCSRHKPVRPEWHCLFKVKRCISVNFF
jgi:hypothetical protein